MLKPFFRKYGWRYIPGFLFLCLSQYLNTRTPLILGEAIERVSGGLWQPFLHEVILLVAVAVSVFLTRFTWRYFLIITSREMEVWLRDELYHHLQLLAPGFYHTHRSGDLMAYAVSDVNLVRRLCGIVMAQLLTAVTTVVLSVYEMAVSIHPGLTFLAVLPIPFAVVAVIVLGQQVQKRTARSQELFARFSGHVQENVNGMRVIKAFAQEKGQHDDFERESDDMRRAAESLYRVSNAIAPLIRLLFSLSYVVGLAYGGRLVLEGSISLGDYVAFNSYLALILAPIVQLGRVMDMLQRGIASYKRLRTLFNEPEIPASERVTEGYTLRGEIRAEHLTFTYPGSTQPVLTDISFTVPAGHTLGVVGPTGSGKSTLIDLLIKLERCEAGMLYLDGEDITKIPAAAIREQTGYVPQVGFLFKGSIEENVSFFSGADTKACEKALDTAGLMKDIAAMPEGLATDVVERGNHLSGGQRQRAALARALVRDPKLLLLDDTLSAVDAHTETAILTALREETNRRTAVIAAHRLSAVEDADEILFLDKGRIVERGTHAELVAKNGRYAEMLRLQREKGASA